MKPFSVDEYLKNPLRKIVTRDGKSKHKSTTMMKQTTSKATTMLLKKPKLLLAKPVDGYLPILGIMQWLRNL